MNNEPVAWMAHDNSGASIKCTDEFCIPLYTHPAKTLTEDEGKVCARCGAIAYDPVITQTAKTLTDEEINELYADYQNPDYYSREVIFDQLGFARAILRKAQEKC